MREPAIAARTVRPDAQHRTGRQRAVQMREQHRLGIARNTRFPAQRCNQRGAVDVEQNQIVPAGEDPVRRQVHLLLSREVDKSHLAQLFGSYLPRRAGHVPVPLPAEMDKWFGARVLVAHAHQTARRPAYCNTDGVRHDTSLKPGNTAGCPNV